MRSLRRLRWNDWNIAHVARHEVVPEEVEQVCHGKPWFSQTYQERIRAIGPTKAGRMLTVILAPEGEGMYYVITARPASRKERRRYQEVQEGGETL